MSEYFHVEKPFLDHLATLGWTVIDQGHGLIPSGPAASLRGSFHEWLLPEIFRASVRALNRTADDKAWLTDRQLDDLRDQIVRQLGIERGQGKDDSRSARSRHIAGSVAHLHVVLHWHG